MSTFLELAQALQMAIKAIQMYTSAHPRSQDALRGLATSMADWLKNKPELQIAASAGKVFVDGTPMESQSLHLSALVRQLSERQIAGFVVQRGVPPEELLSMIEILILKPAKLEEMGGVSKVMENRNLRYVSLSQTQYREVRDGGQEDLAGPGATQETSRGTADQSAREPLAIDIAEALDFWQQHLIESAKHLVSTVDEGFLGYIQAANLNNLGKPAEEAGWGPGFPTALQIESLRQALQGLPGEKRLSIVKGMGSLPASPVGLHMGFQALAPEVVALASVELLARGISWEDLKETLYEIISLSPQRQAMLSGVESGFRAQGFSAEQFGDLLRQLDWDHQPMEEKIRRALDDHRLWDLSLEQRLAFMRELLKQGRMEPFLRVLELVLENLALEDSRPREAATLTLAGVSHWTCEESFPMEAEGPMLDCLKGNFGWEPAPHIHRSIEEGLEALILCFLKRGELHPARQLLEELAELLAFLEDKQEWRTQSLARLLKRLVEQEPFAIVVERLQQADPDAVRVVFLPYFEVLGEAGARELVRILGEEPDRKRRGRLLEIIRAMGPLALTALSDSLQSPTWYLVRNTLNLLAEMGDVGSLGEVALCLQHPDGRVRRAAVRAAWKLGGTASASHLLPIFPTTDPETQVEILFGLGQIRAGVAVFMLADFARSAGGNERVRIKTLETLGQIRNPAAIPSLADVIRRKGRIFSTAEPIAVRLAAAGALATIGTTEAIETLGKLVEDEPKNQDRDLLQQVLGRVSHQRENP